MAKNHGKKRSRRMSGSYIKGIVDEELPLGTLAAKSLVRVPFDEVAAEKTFISSIVASYSMNNWTNVLEAGPILIGIAHSDYTAAEIEEVIENTGSWNRGDKIAQERSKRLIRIIGQFSTEGITGAKVSLNDGKPIKTKLGWSLNTGRGLSLWAYNLGVAAVATTDPNVFASGHCNLWA